MTNTVPGWPVEEYSCMVYKVPYNTLYYLKEWRIYE